MGLLVISMLGKPTNVTPFMRQTRNDGLIDNGLAVLEYPIATATIRVSVAEIDGMKHRRLIVCGTKGTFELCPIEPPGNEYYTRHLTPRLTLKYDTEDYKAGSYSRRSAISPLRIRWHPISVKARSCV